MRRISALPTVLCAVLSLAGGVAPAWADTPVEIEGADEDTRKAILELLPDRDEPTTLFEAERIAEEAAARATAWLRSEGYYAAEVTPEAQDNPVRARLIIAPGARFKFAQPKLVFDGVPPSEMAMDAARAAMTHVTPEAPARAAAVLQAEADAVNALLIAGYADAIANDRRVVVDHATNMVSPEFHVSAGAFARLGAVRAEPSEVIRTNYLSRLRNWRSGQPYTPDHLAQIRRDLTTTGAVASVSTRLDPPGADGLRDVVLEIEPAKRNAYELGGGYSTTEGIGIEAQWTRRNLTGRADSLTTGVTLGEKLQSVNVDLVRPHAVRLGHARHYSAALAQETTDAFSRQGLALGASVDAAPRLRLATSYGVRLAIDHYDESGGNIRDANVLSGFGDIRRDTTGASLDPRAGTITEFRLEPTVSVGDATIGFLRATGEGRIYRSLGDKQNLTLAARGRVGWLEPVSGSADDVPADRRFYAGGGGSVRGYAYNSIYPHERDLLGLTPGGQGSLETSLEARWRFDNGFGAAAFIDGGNAFDTWTQAADLKWGVGIGARYSLGFAPLRVDIAFPLDRQSGEAGYALYISLGQAF